MLDQNDLERGCRIIRYALELQRMSRRAENGFPCCLDEQFPSPGVHVNNGGGIAVFMSGSSRRNPPPKPVILLHDSRLEPRTQRPTKEKGLVVGTEHRTLRMNQRVDI